LQNVEQHWWMAITTIRNKIPQELVKAFVYVANATTALDKLTQLIFTTKIKASRRSCSMFHDQTFCSLFVEPFVSNLQLVPENQS
jgi:hypothetical protein